MHPVKRDEFRWTVAVWPEEDDRPPWRLDRLLPDTSIVRDRNPVFEIVDEENPSRASGMGHHTALSSLWVERVVRPVRGMIGGEWFVTEEWENIREARGGSRPVALRERMLGIVQVLEPATPLSEAFQPTERTTPVGKSTNRSARWIFSNRRGESSWLFLPMRLDPELFDAAEAVDRLSSIGGSQFWSGRSRSSEQAQMLEELSRLLGRQISPMGTDRPATFLTLEPCLGSTDVLPLTCSAFQPTWSVICQDRSIGGPTFLSMLENMEKHGVAVRKDRWDEWVEENVLPPKLLLEPEEAEVYTMLGEPLPVLWDDEPFQRWASELSA